MANPTMKPTTDQLIDTPFGCLRARWSRDGLWACEFGSLSVKDNLDAVARSNNSHRNVRKSETVVAKDAELDKRDRLSELLRNYFRSGVLNFDIGWLDWGGVSRFHRSALEQCHRIPAGTTVTYGELAMRAGSPKAARAVGIAMANNRWPILIPCHRVVGASGKLTGYSGAGGLATKRSLLELESPQSNLFSELVS